MAKINGFPAVLSSVSHYSSRVRIAALNVLGHAIQNNPTVQNEVISIGAMKILLRTWKSDEDVKVRPKALLAISGLVRNCEAGLERFLVEGGLPILFDTLRDASSSIALKRRSVFFLSYLVTAAQVTASKVVQQKLHTVLLQFVESSGDVDLQEKSLDCLESLISNSAKAREALLKSGCGSVLRELANRFQAMAADDPEHDPSIPLEQIERILKLLEDPMMLPCP